MSKSAVLYLLVYGGGLFFSLLKGPFSALLIYVFTYFNMNTRVNWWLEDLPNIRWNFIAFVFLVVSCFLHKEQLSKIKFRDVNNFKWLCLLFALMLVIWPFSYQPSLASKYLYDFFRYVLIFPVIIKCITTRRKYEYFIWLYLFCCFYLSIKAHTVGVRVQGRLEGVGTPDAGDSNLFAALLVTAVPFLIGYILKSSVRIKIIAVVILVVVLDTIVLCSSRGAFVGLVASLLVLLFWERDKRIRRNISIGIVGVFLLFVWLMDPVFINRIASLEHASESSSGRLEIWKSGIRMIKDYPFGTGGGGFVYLSPYYLPEEVLSVTYGVRSMHNTYLKITVEQGPLGLFLFFGFLGSTLLTLRSLQRRLLSSYSQQGSQEDDFFYLQAGMLMSSLMGLLICSIFIDRIYFEPLYWLCALGPVLSNLLGEKIRFSRSH